MRVDVETPPGDPGLGRTVRSKRKRIVVHDFGAYPYPFALSRVLASRGHEVQHVYCASHHTTPAGTFEKKRDDPDSLSIVGVKLQQTLEKRSLFKRWRQEREYGRLSAAVTASFEPDVVLSANMPLDAQAQLTHLCRSKGIPFVFWVQDLIGVAADRLLRQRIPVLGRFIGGHYLRMERGQLAASHQIIVLTEDFVPILNAWEVDTSKVHVIHNWAPVEELPMRSKDNDWSRHHHLHDKRCFLYAGTLGLKHNPDLLVKLAIEYRAVPHVRVVVLTQGAGAAWLTNQRQTHGLENLLVLPYEPFERMPEVMATADILVAVLEPDAGIFSVPSKVLAYMCSGRALLLALPLDNLAARIAMNEEVGVVVDPADLAGFLAGAHRLLENADERARRGANARAYAEATFRIDEIASRFMNVLALATTN